jgi:hypothetical protein
MRCALYLRPAGLAQWPHFDDVVKGWLREQGYEPVDGGCYDTVVCLPYDGGGDYYHCDVSVAMAARILEYLAVDGEVKWIHLCGTEIDWKDDSLTAVRLELDVDRGGRYGGKPTLAIMSEGETAEADRAIRETGYVADQDIGSRWRPPALPAPMQPRAPGQPFYTLAITFGGRRS